MTCIFSDDTLLDPLFTWKFRASDAGYSNLNNQLTTQNVLSFHSACRQTSISLLPTRFKDLFLSEMNNYLDKNHDFTPLMLRRAEHLCTLQHCNHLCLWLTQTNNTLQLWIYSWKEEFIGKNNAMNICCSYLRKISSSSANFIWLELYNLAYAWSHKSLLDNPELHP